MPDPETLQTCLSCYAHVHPNMLHDPITRILDGEPTLCRFCAGFCARPQGFITPEEALGHSIKLSIAHAANIMMVQLIPEGDEC